MTATGAARARLLQEQRRVEQGLAELVGVIQGIVADGTVSAEEAERLSAWTEANPDVASRWPANLLALRLAKIMADGRVDAGERRSLSALLGPLASPSRWLAASLATDLPVDDPPPPVLFESRTFVFAGEMVFGPRRSCEREVTELGGACERTVSRRTDYLVLGGLAALDWTQEGFGAQVDAAVRLRARGAPVAIIAEEHWAQALP